jgi:DNA-binding NtrC family response regulator
MAKIMILDSDEATRLLYSEELKEDGHQVTTYESGFRLLENIKGDLPKIVITGVRLIDYDPYEIIRDIHNTFPKIVIIFSTSRTEFWPIAERLGVCYFFEKSFDLTNLKKTIREIEEMELACSA